MTASGDGDLAYTATQIATSGVDATSGLTGDNFDLTV